MSALNARLQAAGCACAKGSVTDSSGQIDPSLKPLFQQSAGNIMGVQNQNPLGNYQGSNPMQVAGPNEVQRYGLDNIMGAGGPNQLDAMALQDILRSPAMAQAGPTTGQYDPSQEMDLSQYFGALQTPHADVPQDWGQVGVSGMGPDVGPTTPYGAPGTPTGGGKPGTPGNPGGVVPGGGGPGGSRQDPNPHHSGDPDSWETQALGPRPDAASAAAISPGSGASMQNIAPLAALALGGGAGNPGDESWMDTGSHAGDPRLSAPLGFGESIGSRLGMQTYKDPSGNTRYADPSQAGRVEGTNVHGQGVVDSSGKLQQMYFAPSQGVATSPNQQLGAGSMGARPTDPALAARWDQIMANHPGATVRH